MVRYFSYAFRKKKKSTIKYYYCTVLYFLLGSILSVKYIYYNPVVPGFGTLILSLHHEVPSLVYISPYELSAECVFSLYTIHSHHFNDGYVSSSHK